MVATESDCDRFFAGFLAAVRLEFGDDVLTANRVAINRAFWAAIDNEANRENRDAYAIDFDPLYAVSPWFERALTRAQRNLLISFPNPSYEKVAIRLNGEQAKQLLDEIKEPNAVVALAKSFIAHLKAS